jgi:signal transduction histidine kinase
VTPASEEAHDRAILARSAQLGSVGNLVRGVAHEINTPLGALASNLDVIHRALDRLQGILADEKVSEDELVEVRKIVRALASVGATSTMAVDRMKHVVETLRSFGRPDRSQIERVDLTEGLRGTLELLRHELGSIVVVDEDLQPLPPVECYAGQVNQVFMNLITNALHAMPGGGTLRLRSRAAADRVAFEIEDTGKGIPEEMLERIFEPGFTTKGVRVGMGLGLAICNEIVDRHGGAIAVSSTPGVGSTFGFWLPLSIPPRPDEECRPREQAQPPAGESQ